MSSRFGDNDPIEDIIRTDEHRTTPQNITSIIILTYNNLDYNKLCIESIRQYTEPDSYEVIAIDNHSIDGTVEWLQNQRDIKVILNNENVGFPAGCNQGIKLAIGNSILLLNNDTIVTPNWLINLKKCLYSSSNIGAVGAVSNSCSNAQTIPCEYSSVEELMQFATQVNHSNPELWEDRTRLVGYCMLIKAAIINEIGLLDEAFSPGNYEDDDYCLRIRKAGYRLVLCRDTFIHHFGSVSFGEQAKQFNNLLKTNRQKFFEKWGLPPHLAAPFQLTQDLMVKKWFAYQHEFNYYKHWLENTRRKFFALIDQAEFALLSGDLEKTALLVKQAADYAYHSHPGFFTSRKVELILRKAAKKLSVRVAIKLPQKSIDKKNILHVISQGNATSTHVRTIERWMCADSAAVHSIIVTLNSTAIPQSLVDAAIHSGGWCKTLDTIKLTLCQQAKVLRDAAAMWADLVVLHIHPHDPVAPIAFGTLGGPPVVFVNHADHAFTIGMSAADMIVDHREFGQRITLSRRNLNNTFVLPVPLGKPQQLPEKQTARKELGVDADKVVFLTIAKPYQLVSCGEYSFSYLVRELVTRYSNIELLVVVPSDVGELTQLQRQSSERIKIFDVQPDLAKFYSAADVYLDSLPVGSVAEAIEAGVLGIPIVGLATNIPEHFSSDILPNIIKTHFPSFDELFLLIDKLVNNEVYRINQGNYIKSSILQHYYPRQEQSLNTLYSLLPNIHKPAEILVTTEQSANNSDIIWAYFQYRSGLSSSSFDSNRPEYF